MRRVSRGRSGHRVASFAFTIAAKTAEAEALEAEIGRLDPANATAADAQVRRGEVRDAIAAANARRDKLKVTFPDLTPGLWVPVLREARAS